MAIFRICPNQTSQALQNTYGATPLRIPEARLKPLMILGKRGDQVDFRGEFHYLLTDPAPLDLRRRSSTVADAALTRTQSMDLDFGMKILSGFLQGFGLGLAPIAAGIKGARQISFSFDRVKRLWVDINELGSQLANRRLDLHNPAVEGYFTGDKPYDMLLVTDALVSNSFVLRVESSRDQNFSVQLPGIQQAVADAKLKVKLNQISDKEISFQGKDLLTFAFTSFRLSFDPSDQSLRIGEEIRSRGLEGTGKRASKPVHADMLPAGEPGMLMMG